jgi:aryl carrier-like protein
MAAYYRRRGEDRVTEVFAALLERSPELLRGLLECAEVPSANSYDIRTQVRSGEVTIDLEILGRGTDGSPAWLLWSEHKVNDPLTARQLQNEWHALAGRAGSASRHLIAITLDTPTPDAAAFAPTIDCKLLRWTTLTGLARAALDQGRSQDPAYDSSTPAHHLLAEWIAFSDNELEAPVERLTPERVRLLPEAEKALDTVEDLLDAGFTRACSDIGAGTPRNKDGELHATPPGDSWLSDRGFQLYTQYEPEGFGGVEDPCLVVGAWIEGDDAVAARRSRELHTLLSERGLTIWDEDDRHGGWIEFGVALGLAELALHPTLELQEEAFSETCARVLRALHEPL